MPQIPTTAKSITETVIREQFPFWQAALQLPVPVLNAGTIVLTGCGTSYYLAQSLACAYNSHGQRAIAVPGAEWAQRPECYLPDCSDVLVVGLSRSGTTTETVEAIAASRARGWLTFAVSCERGSEILLAADRGLYLPTHAAEGIVMSVSASLMLLGGLRLAGIAVPDAVIKAAQVGLAQMDAGAPSLLRGRGHFVYLGAGANYGIATEGCLKLQEMSLSFSQSFHPMEYRHGPISLIDEHSVVVILYSDDTRPAEAKIAADVQAKGARVIGINGPGDLRIDLGVTGLQATLAVLPALQILGEHVALLKGINTETPRHLTKVVVLT
jgi:glutamine---fructose-6-phosphate transaminase (isomerizing)